METLPESNQTPGDHPSESSLDRMSQLQKLLAVYPTDIITRCGLASLLEKLGQQEEALFNWKAVLACDPNNLEAREGVARCWQQTGRPRRAPM